MTRAKVSAVTEKGLQGLSCNGFGSFIDKHLLGKDNIQAVALSIDNEIVAVGGVRKLPWSMCEGFLSTKEALPPYVYVQLRDWWKKLTEGIQRAQMEVDIRNPNHIAFAYSLGTVPEGIMRKAGPNGEDYIVFVRV